MKLDTIGFDRSGTLPVLAQHSFEMHDGQLVHSIDGRQRAVVPPAGLDDYAAQWPACRPVVDAIKAAPVAQSFVFRGERGREEAERIAQDERTRQASEEPK